VAEVVVQFFLAGQDAVVGGEKAELRGVTGGIGFAGFGFGAGGVLGVAAIGFDLSFGGHVFFSNSFQRRIGERERGGSLPGWTVADDFSAGGWGNRQVIEKRGNLVLGNL